MVVSFIQLIISVKYVKLVLFQVTFNVFKKFLTVNFIINYNNVKFVKTIFMFKYMKIQHYAFKSVLVVLFVILNIYLTFFFLI